MSMGLPPRTTVIRRVSPGWCFSTSVRSSSRVRTRLCSTATMRSADSWSGDLRMDVGRELFDRANRLATSLLCGASFHQGQHQ